MFAENQKSRRLPLKINLFLTAVVFFSVAITAETKNYRYAAVISSGAYSEPGWKAVADSLVKKHKAGLFTWVSSVTETKDALSKFKPDYIGYIARPVIECNSSFIVTVSRLSRQLDEDPYGDAVWGIITGPDASAALRAISDTLLIRTVLAASNNLSYEPPIRRFYQAIGMTCDSYIRTDYLFPENRGKVYTVNKRPDNESDRIVLVSKWLNAGSLNVSIAGEGTITGPVDCIITGGHGNVNLWQCHYPDVGTEGFMRSSDGKLYGAPYSGGRLDINAPTPKVYWCASNCLMGNPDNKNNFVYGAFGSGKAVQMFGFVNNASSGNEFMAWGVYDRITKSAGKYTLPEGFFISNNNALFEILHPSGQFNANLVRNFMDSTVIYGDPAAKVNFQEFGDSASVYKTDLTFTQNGSGTADFTFKVTMLAHDLEYGAGYCYQFRPISLLPVRIDPSTVVITGNDGHLAEITDNLLIWEMLSNKEKLPKGESRVLRWTAKIMDLETDVRNYSTLNNRSVPKPRIMAFPGTGKEILVKVHGLPAGRYDIRVVGMSGRQRYRGNFISSGTGMQSFTLEHAGAGVQLIQLTSDGQVLSGFCCKP